VRRRVAAVGTLALAVAAVTFVARASPLVTDGARIVHFSIHSSLVHETLPVTAIVAAGASDHARPLLVFLHGKDANQDSSVDSTLFAALAALGPRAPDIVFPYGGADSYWHDRADGAWGSYVYNEVIPHALRRLHADPNRVAIGGISMGGFGALDIARLHPRRFCAVGGHSAALWVSGGESAPGAFDDAADFARHDVIAAARTTDPYPSTAVWIDVGAQDPFRSSDTTLVQRLRAGGHAVQFHVWPGSHDYSYWDSHWPNYLRFYASALANCHHA
jgi:S-formylglutathione hydrolase FrmB